MIKKIHPLIQHLLNDDWPESQYLAAFLALNTGQKGQAEDIVHRIPGNFPYLTVETHENLSTLFNLNISLFSEGQLPAALNSAQKPHCLANCGYSLKLQFLPIIS